jgi:hypothetical protein
MDSTQLVSFILDIVLIIAAILSYLARPKIGGEIARGLRVLMAGVMILGFAHLIETGLFILLNLELQVNEILHRLLVMAGFAFVIWGFVIMRRAFQK